MGCSSLKHLSTTCVTASIFEEDESGEHRQEDRGVPPVSCVAQGCATSVLAQPEAARRAMVMGAAG